MIPKALIALGLLAVAAAPAEAASFDCRKAGTPIEKAICADPKLSQADADVAKAFAALSPVVGDREPFTEGQRAWLKQRDAIDPGDAASLLDLHGRRIADLRAQFAKATAPFPAADVAKTCVPIAAAPAGKACTVESSGPVPGGKDLVYQAVAYTLDDDLSSHAIVVLAPVRGQPGQLGTVVVNYTESGGFDDPKVVVNSFGRFLDLGGSESGTGNFNIGQLYIQQADGLRLVDSDSWEKQLAKRLPEGLGAWKGIYPDFGKMIAGTPLWKSDDGNCCPTGGYADVTLGFTGQKIVLKDVKVKLGEKAASGE